MIAVAVLFAFALFALIFIKRKGDPSVAEHLDETWDSIAAGQTSGLDRFVMRASRPVANLPQVHLNPESGPYKSLRLLLVTGGNLYGGQVPVFLSVQVFSAFVAAGVITAVLASGATGMILVAGAILAIGFAAQPYSKVRAAAKKRTEQVDAALPEFAELLLMPLTSGYGVLPAMDFTAGRLDSPVAQEVTRMLEQIQSRSRSEAEAFREAAERLGTPAAQSFFNALAQAYLDGVRISEVIKGQSESLRKLHYERMREKLKKLPNAMALVMGLHLMPTMFAIVLMPILLSLGRL